MLARWLSCAACVALTACSGTQGDADTSTPAATSTQAPPPLATPSAAPSAQADPTAKSGGGDAGKAAAATEPAPSRCGELDCFVFDGQDKALAFILAQNPRVLAVGESHAQKGDEGVASATKRFTEQMLPAIAPRATDLIIELWVPDSRCDKKKVESVAKETKPVTKSQAATNQNEFVTLGAEAKRLGVRPHALVPSCEQYDKILNAKENALDEMLTMIASLTADKAKELLAKSPEDSGKMVVAYGGALHNDLEPRKGREAWSFGPGLTAHTGGKYIELDLIVRELIKDNETWRSLPWYSHFDKEKDPEKTVILRLKPGSYVFVFPKSK